MARPKEHKPETILAAACSLFHQEGVGVSTARIAKAAGVSNGTLFNYFPTKQALIDALYVSIKSDLGQAVGVLDSDQSIEQRMRQVWDRWLGWSQANPEDHHVVRLLHGARLAGEQAQIEGMAALQAAIDLLNDALADGALVDLPLDYLAGLIEQQLDQAVLAQLSGRQVDIAFAVLWNGISSPSNRTTNPLKRVSA